MRYSFFALLLALGCSKQPAGTPTPQDIAIIAINAVDAALAVEIATSTDDAGANVKFEKEVALLQSAADVVKAGGSACSVIPGLSLVSTDIGCAQCAAPIQYAKEAFKCQ